MAVSRIVQVAGSNSLDKAKEAKELQKEIRELTRKTNEALRQLSQMMYTSASSGGTKTVIYSNSPVGGGNTTINIEDIVVDEDLIMAVRIFGG